MVLAQKVGMKRGFGVGLLLTIVTFGIYAVYWNYRAHSELYRQFELARESRDDGMVWYVLGLVLPPFLLAYVWVFASNVTYLRDRIGLRRSMTPGRLLILVGIGAGAIAVGLIVLNAALVATGEEPSAEEEPIVYAAGAVALLGVLTAMVLFPVAYAGLQRDINELWDAYDARLAYLAAHPEELRPIEMSGLAPAHDPAALAPPLRAEVEALRARHPHLRALPELDTLLGRAEAGDAQAREWGEELLRDVVGLLHERADVLQRIEAREREIEARRAAEPEGAPGELDALEPREERDRLEVLEQALFAPRQD